MEIIDFLILSASAILLFCMMGGCTELMGGDGPTFVERLDEEPNDFININEQQMEQFSHLREATNRTGEHVETPSDEWYELKEFFGGSSIFVKYQGEYYYVRLFGIV